MKYTRIIISIIILIALILVGIGIYLFFFTNHIAEPGDTNTNYAPFGTLPTNTTKPTPENTQNNQPSDSTNNYTVNTTSPLFKISSDPIGGADAFIKKVGTTSVAYVNYTNRGTGNVYQFDTATKLVTRLTNTTIPNLYETYWLNPGNSFIAEHMENDGTAITTILGTLVVQSSTTPMYKVQGMNMQQNISALSLSPKKDKLFFFSPNESGGVDGTIYALGTRKNISVFSTQFTEWLTNWSTENVVTLTTKPSSSVAGNTYFLDISKSTLTKVFGGINGLTTLPNSTLAYVLYSGYNNLGYSTGIYSVKDSGYQVLSQVTVPEKCIWSLKEPTTAYCSVPASNFVGNYPEDWYQGKVLFNDSGIYKINASTGETKRLYKLPINESIDAINLFLDSKEENLFFTNKKDYSLWGLTIKE